MPPLPVGRFQVMAALQAARAQRLGLPVRSAESWGLNRAIFIAVAKRGLRAGGRGPTRPAGKEFAEARRERIGESFGEFFLGDDKAYKVEVDGMLLLTIGGEIQTPEAYAKQVRARFGKAYRAAWTEAQEIVRAYPSEVLESADEFFSKVYRPRRDELARRWSEMAEEAT